MNVLYGATGFASVVQREIDARREVVLTVRGWKRKIALRILAFFMPRTNRIHQKGVGLEPYMLVRLGVPF